MSERAKYPLLPYSRVVGQKTLRQLLEVAYVMGSKGGGVLLSGERGTAKSTIVRSFANMMYGQLPVTLPINATDDRVMGGWDIDTLMKGDPKWKQGLLQQAGEVGEAGEAGEAGMLYIDEVNLLDDHVINLILDVVSTGVLVVERDGIDDSQVNVSFMLVGTMNPDEGGLRPQLLDRFGLFVPVTAERNLDIRRDILLNVLKFDTERDQVHSDWLDEASRDDAEHAARLKRATKAAKGIEPTDPDLLDVCVRVTEKFKVVGHRAEIVMARAACAVAALAGREKAWPEDVASIAPYAVIHRRRDDADGLDWSKEDDDRLMKVISGG